MTSNMTPTHPREIGVAMYLASFFTSLFFTAFHLFIYIIHYGSLALFVRLHRSLPNSSLGPSVSSGIHVILIVDLQYIAHPFYQLFISIVYRSLLLHILMKKSLKVLLNPLN